MIEKEALEFSFPQKRHQLYQFSLYEIQKPVKRLLYPMWTLNQLQWRQRNFVILIHHCLFPSLSMMLSGEKSQHLASYWGREREYRTVYLTFRFIFVEGGFWGNLHLYCLILSVDRKGHQVAGHCKQRWCLK